MAIDTSIYGRIEQPKPVNLLAQYAGMMQLQDAQQQQRMNQLKFDEYERGREEKNVLARIYRDSLNPDGTVNRTKLFSGAAAANLGAQIPGLQKTFAEQDKASADVAKVNVETEFKRVETAHKRIDLTGQVFGFVKDNPTVENAIRATDMLVQNGILTPEQAEQSKARLAANPSPDFIRSMATQAFQNALTAKEQLPKLQTVNAGDRHISLAVNPITGQATDTGSTVINQSPDNAATTAASIENNKRTVSASLANAAAVRETANATRDAARIQANQGVEMKLADDYRAQSKPFKEVSDAYRTINATLDKATTSPAATLAGATKFMKLLDPGSVVRESELGMALAATGVFDRMGNYFNTLRSGKVLTPSQVADFKAITQQIYAAAQAGQKKLDENYRRQAETYGLRPDMIVQDLGQNTAEPVDLGNLPTSSGKVVDFGSLK